MENTNGSGNTGNCESHRKVKIFELLSEKSEDKEGSIEPMTSG